MSNKLGFMRSATENLRVSLRPSQYLKHPGFTDRLLKVGPSFSHSWANMAHMHDLRLWTITYSPSQRNNVRRLQEIHYLNNEMWYNVYNALWKRWLIMVVFFFFVTRINKKRYMKKYNTDSHDANWRDTTGHM